MPCEGLEVVRRARSPRQLQAAKLLPRWRRDPIFCPSLTTSSGYTSRADKICNVMSLDEPASNSKSAPVEITEGRSERHMPVLTRLDEPSSFFFQTKRPCMIARSGCGASKPNRGRFPIHPPTCPPSGSLKGGKRRMSDDDDA